MAELTGDNAQDFFKNFVRTASFWQRATSIYLSYKGAQVRAAFASAQGKTDEEIKEQIWQPQHEHAGDAMYDLCVQLRGFYLKAGQFIGSRNDFVPEPICQRLCLLCDKVPPMSPALAESSICHELGVKSLSDVFEWIDLEKPLGSASVAQVHKGKLRSFPDKDTRAMSTHLAKAAPKPHVVVRGQTAWEICNLHGVSPQELTRLNKGVDLDRVQPGQVINIPPDVGLDTLDHDNIIMTTTSSASDKASHGSTKSSRGASAVTAVLRAQASGTAPADGLVAVKIQYPNALGAMSLDLRNLRAAAYYLSKTELKFDLVSAIDELNKQIKLEFDFNREARVMDSIADHLSDVSDRIQVPRSIPGLVSNRILVMHFLSGIPLLDVHKHIQGMSALKQKQGKRRIMERVSEAYGRMLFGEGLFQADGHPGNILVSQGGRIGLLDYGQSKQLSQHQKLTLARLIVELDKGDSHAVNHALTSLGIVTENNNIGLRNDMAYGMFDTRGKVDPFDPNSPIKSCAITTFPPDLFFVLRVVQLLRGMSHGMGIDDFSSAAQWAPLARHALCQGDHGVSGFKSRRMPGVLRGQQTDGLWRKVARILLAPLPFARQGAKGAPAAHATTA